MPTEGDLAARLHRFAAAAEPDSPLYAVLTRAAADDDVCLEVAAAASPGQPEANLLLAAVHFLLLEGEQDPLAAHYAGVSAEGEPGALFVDFCHRHRARLTELVAGGRVQTNEVARCLYLLPAFSAVAAAGPWPLALIELGASAGLNLCFDRYRYDYGSHGTAGPEDSPLTLGTEVRAGKPPVPTRMPEVAWRRGIDIAPVDLGDEAAVRWCRALLWPEQPERIARFDTAVALARRDPPLVMAGDAAAALAALLPDVPADTIPVVFHSYLIKQLPEESQRRLDAVFEAHQGPIHRISAEPPGPTLVFPEIIHTRYPAGRGTPTRLGRAHHHGAWIEWGEA